MVTESGKNRKTLAGNLEHLFRIIQSVPSKKAEPIKIWLAKVGHERIQEMSDPEKPWIARLALEEKTGKSVVTGQNFLVSNKAKKKLK